MPSKTEAQILGEAYESARNLTKFYMSKLDGLDLHHRPEINGVKFNSPYWIAAHLVWTENFLILQGLENTDACIPWLEEYGFGSNIDEVKVKPDYKEVLTKFDEVHTKAMGIINSLTDEQMKEDNHIDANFGGNKSKAGVLRHAIRHEPMHVGQISWILKANGVKMV